MTRCVCGTLRVGYARPRASCSRSPRSVRQWPPFAIGTMACSHAACDVRWQPAPCLPATASKAARGTAPRLSARSSATSLERKTSAATTHSAPGIARRTSATCSARRSRLHLSARPLRSVCRRCSTTRPCASHNPRSGSRRSKPAKRTRQGTPCGMRSRSSAFSPAASVPQMPPVQRRLCVRLALAVPAPRHASTRTSRSRTASRTQRASGTPPGFRAPLLATAS